MPKRNENIWLYEYLYMNVHSSIVHNSQKKETQMSVIDESVNNVVYSHNRVLAGRKKEWNTDMCYDMDEPWKHQAKWNQYMIPFKCDVQNV